MFPSTTFGEKLDVFESEGLTVTRTRHAAGLQLPRHCHANANVTLVLDGQFEEVVQERTYDCRPSTALLKPAGAAHLNRYGPQAAHCLIVEFKPHFLNSFPEIERVLAEPTCSYGGSASALGIHMYKEVCSPDSASAMMLEGLALQLLAEAGRLKEVTERSPEPPMWLANLRDFIAANFREDLSLSDIAAVAGVHAVHLNKSHKKYFGTTVGVYVRHLRLQLAAQLLTETNLPLSAIAIEAGFCDQSHFTNVFRRYTRSTPGEFRRDCRRPQ